MIHVAYTGTQRGLTVEQDQSLRSVLVRLMREGGYNSTLHHGDCIGGDESAHNYAFRLGWKLIIHPQNVNKAKRAYCNNKLSSPSTIIRPPNKPLPRNWQMVEESDVLVACPYEYEEMLRSGTWTTMRYARQQKKPVITIWRDGSVDWSEYEPWSRGQ